MIILFLVIVFAGFMCFSGKACAGSAGRLNMNAESKFGYSNFERTPKPELVSTGSNLSQNYRLYADGGVFKYGMLNAMVGVAMEDKYRKKSMDYEDKVHFNYGRWVEIETITRHETDEDIFYSGTAEPQSPIHSLTKKYVGKFNINRATSVTCGLESKERNDLLTGDDMDEITETRNIRVRTDTGPINFNGEYRETDFSDNRGERSDIESKSTSFDLFYTPRPFFNVGVFYNRSEDRDLDEKTELNSTDSRVEFTVSPAKELRIRDKMSLRQDEDTNTSENIVTGSNEIIVDYDPTKQISVELAYKKDDEDKKRESVETNSDINEGRARVGFSPYTGISIQGGYEVSDKVSSSSTENLRDTRAYSDFSLEPYKTLRLSGSLSTSEQENTYTDEIESETTSIAGTLQYIPSQKLTWFMRADTSRTDNPTTVAFTKTDTISSSLDMDLFSYLETSLRTSGQKTTGSSDAAFSERWLNSLEVDVKLLDNLKLSAEYELIISTGTSPSDEKLYDMAVFYNEGQFDLSLRLQRREVTKSNPMDKIAVLSDIKYRITKNVILSLRLSYTDHTDDAAPENSYESTVIESSLFLRF